MTLKMTRSNERQQCELWTIVVLIIINSAQDHYLLLFNEWPIISSNQLYYYYYNERTNWRPLLKVINDRGLIEMTMKIPSNDHFYWYSCVIYWLLCPLVDTHLLLSQPRWQCPLPHWWQYWLWYWLCTDWPSPGCGLLLLKTLAIVVDIEKWHCWTTGSVLVTVTTNRHCSVIH